MTLYEVNEAASIIRETAHPDVNLIFGAVIDEAMADDVRITVIATGFDSDKEPEIATVRTVGTVSATPVQRRAEPSELFNTQVADRDNIEIPAFLRRRG